MKTVKTSVRAVGVPVEIRTLLLHQTAQCYNMTVGTGHGPNFLASKFVESGELQGLSTNKAFSSKS